MNKYLWFKDSRGGGGKGEGENVIKSHVILMDWVGEREGCRPRARGLHPCSLCCPGIRCARPPGHTSGENGGDCLQLWLPSSLCRASLPLHAELLQID